MNGKRKYAIVVILMMLILVFTACSDILTSDKSNENQEDLKVHYIDVGQGDAIFIQQGEYNMLIDAGDNQYGKRVVEYLKSQGVSKLDYIIGTHPHADHIGGLDDVINSFEVEKIIMPRVSHNTKTFEDVLLAIQQKQLKVTTPNVGSSYELGNALWTIIAPNSDGYQSLNDYSVGVVLEYQDTSFLFTGDAQEQSEKEMLDLHPEISLEADVLKLGHHGSSTSTTDDFLKAVNPKYGVIQLGQDNSYGHPHREIIEKLEENNIGIYRNDLHGDIIAISDGRSIEFQTKNSFDNQEGKRDNIQAIYIGNKNTNVLHIESCNQLPNEENRVYFQDKNQGIDQGFQPHSLCIP